MKNELQSYRDGHIKFSSKNLFNSDGPNYVHAYLHADYDCRMHTHDFFEINIVMRGSGEHYIEESVVPTKMGDVFIIPPEIKHCYYSQGKIDVFHILLKTEFVEKYEEELNGLSGYKLLFDIEPYIRSSSGKTCNLHLEFDELVEIESELDKIIRAESEKQYTYQTILTLFVIATLSHKIKNSLDKEKNGRLWSADIAQVMELISNDISEKLTLKSLSSSANISKSTLNRMFKSILGISPMEYVNKRRIELAKSYLKEGKLSKSEIAQACGFYDSAHLNKNLKSFNIQKCSKSK